MTLLSQFGSLIVVGNIECGLGEEEMNLAIEEVKRKGGTSSPGVVAVERLPTVNTTIEGYSAIPTNSWDSLNHIEEVVVEKEIEMEEDSEEEEEKFINSEVKMEPVKSLREVTGLQEEEAWLQAVESGNLQQVKSFFLKMYKFFLQERSSHDYIGLGVQL